MTVDGLLDRKQFCLQARPCIFQLGNFTGWAVKELNCRPFTGWAVKELNCRPFTGWAVKELNCRPMSPSYWWQVDAAHRRLNYSYTASAPAYRKAHSWITSVSVEKTKPSSLDVNGHGGCSCEVLSVFLFTLTSSPKSGQQLKKMVIGWLIC